MIKSRCILFIIVMALVFQGIGLSREDVKKDGLVKKIDHILLTPEDPKGLYDFLTKELQLPPAWDYRSYGVFASGAGFAGNVNLEAALFEDENIKTGSKITGIAFEPAAGTDKIILELDAAKIPHQEPRPFFQGSGENKQKAWTTVGLTGLLPGTIIFICEYHYPKKAFDEYKKMVQDALKKSQGGPAGIEYVSEILLLVKDKPGALKKWQKFLAPAKEKNGCFKIGNGPAIRIVKSGKNCVRSIKFKVKSLEKARRFLKSKNLLGSDKNDTVSTDPAKTFDILFEFSTCPEISK
jgi:hypothetical protein